MIGRERWSAVVVENQQSYCSHCNKFLFPKSRGLYQLQ